MRLIEYLIFSAPVQFNMKLPLLSILCVIIFNVKYNDTFPLILRASNGLSFEAFDCSNLDTNFIVLSSQDHENTLDLYQQPGLLVIKISDFIYLKRCKAVNVTTRSTELCYDDIPVTFNERPYFVSSISRLLKTEGIVIPCSSAIPPLFKINGRWYKLINNRYEETSVPLNYQKAIKIALTKDAVYNNLIMSYYGEIPVDPKYNQAKTDSTWIYEAREIFDAIGLGFLYDYAKIFITLGIIFLLCFTISMCMNAYMLYTYYGWTWRMLLSFSGNFTEDYINEKKMTYLEEELDFYRNELNSAMKEVSSVLGIDIKANPIHTPDTLQPDSIPIVHSMPLNFMAPKPAPRDKSNFKNYLKEKKQEKKKSSKVNAHQ